MRTEGLRQRKIIPQFRHFFDLSCIDYQYRIGEISTTIPPEIKDHIEGVLDTIFDPLPKHLNTHKTVKILFQTLAGFDPYTAWHSQENAEVSQILARECGIDDPRMLLNLRRAAMLHDIGKIGILNALDQPAKPGISLEFRMLHAYFTQYILKKFPSLAEIEPISSAVHVKKTGKSYPADLSWDTIPFEAKILAVADALHSITHERPGDGAKSRDDALKILRKYGYDQDIVDTLEKILPQIPQRLIPDVKSNGS